MRPEFVYRNDEHLAIMRRRREWFENTECHLVLWWVEAGQTPTSADAIKRLETLISDGPGERAFTFRSPYPSPSGREKTQCKPLSVGDSL